jgi:hypothetical protein
MKGFKKWELDLICFDADPDLQIRYLEIKLDLAPGPITIQVLNNRSTSNKICHHFKIVDENGLKNTGKTFKLMDFPKIAFVFHGELDKFVIEIGRHFNKSGFRWKNHGGQKGMGLETLETSVPNPDS